MSVDLSAPVMPELYDEPKLMQEMSTTAVIFHDSGGFDLAPSTSSMADELDDVSFGISSLTRGSGCFPVRDSTSCVAAIVHSQRFPTAQWDSCVMDRGWQM